MEHNEQLDLNTSPDESFTRSRISCCGSYLACSDAGKCLNDNPDIASSCIFRERLSTGIIYYGKSANDFSIEEYSDFLNKINNLSNNAFYFMKQLARFYLHDSYLSSNILVYNSDALKELIPLRFFVAYNNDHALLKRFKLKYIRERSGLVGSEYKSKEKLFAELTTNRRDILRTITGRFCYIDFVTAKNRRYFIEAYRGGLLNDDSIAPLPLPLKFESCFLATKK